MADEEKIDARNAGQRRALKLVLAINALQVVVAGGVGIAVESTGLIGAALDNLADTAVYTASLYAVGHTVVAKARAARLSGVLLILLGLGLLLEVIRRFVAGSEPIGLAMMATAAANAATNVVNLRLLRSHREQGVHINASWIFTSNDMLVNGGIILSGAVVMFFDSPLPDLFIGLALVVIVVNGGRQIMREAHEACRENGAS